MPRRPRLALALLLGVASLAQVGVAQAQVTVNPGALDNLAVPVPERPPGGSPRPREQAEPRQQAAPLPIPLPPPLPPPRPSGAPATGAPPPGRPALPAGPPPLPDVPPPVAVPTARPIAPSPVPVAPDAPGTASAVAGGQRVTFGPDRADFNPATEAALREFARSVKAGEAPINVNAFAGGAPEDPSTPRRLSLARALAARAVLMAEGIPSNRILVRALGAAGGDGPADRVDVTSGAKPDTAKPDTAKPGTAKPGAP